MTLQHFIISSDEPEDDKSVIWVEICGLKFPYNPINKCFNATYVSENFGSEDKPVKEWIRNPRTSDLIRNWRCRNEDSIFVSIADGDTFLHEDFLWDFLSWMSQDLYETLSDALWIFYGKQRLRESRPPTFYLIKKNCKRDIFPYLVTETRGSFLRFLKQYPNMEVLFQKRCEYGQHYFSYMKSNTIGLMTWRHKHCRPVVSGVGDQELIKILCNYR